MRDIFGEEDFLLELQDHGIADLTEVNRGTTALHTKTGILLVCTNDAHYLREGDARATTCCCHPDRQDGGRRDRMRYEPKILPPLHGGDGGAVLRLSRCGGHTPRIADRCQLEFTFGKYHLPEFKLPGDTIRPPICGELCEQGLRGGTATESRVPQAAEL